MKPGVGISVPYRVEEMVVGFHEVIDREVVLVIEPPGAAADDLFELDHRVHRPHQHAVGDVTGIHSDG